MLYIYLYVCVYGVYIYIYICISLRIILKHIKSTSKNTRALQQKMPRFRPGGLLSHVLKEVFGVASRRILCHPVGTQGLLGDGDGGEIPSSEDWAKLDFLCFYMLF